MNLLTVREVRERLKVSQACVYTLIEAGVLPCVRIGVGRGTIRIEEGEFEAFVASRCKQTPQCKSKAVPRAAFVHLDASKLRDAWKTGEQS